MKPHQNQTTCHCDAYFFPHREGGGSCNGILAFEAELEEERLDAWRDWKAWQKDRLTAIEGWK